jgi:F-type H+-transporting ATPase subunit b
METLVAPSINLLILVGALAYYLRAPLKQFVKTRHSSLRDELATVREELRQAQARYEQFAAKLKSLGNEVAELKEQSRQDAQAMKARIVSEAQRLSASTVSDARASATGLYADVKSELYAELGGRVLDRAEALLRERLTGDDRARIRQEFSHQLEAAR